MAVCRSISGGIVSLKERFSLDGVGHIVAGSSVVEESIESNETILEKGEIVGEEVLPESGSLHSIGPETNELNASFGCSVLIGAGVNSPMADARIASFTSGLSVKKEAGT